MSRPSLVAPAAVTEITSRLQEAGFETWAVGGALRDAILGDAVGDWDFATRARPEDVQRLFPRTVPVGIDHGTVGVLQGGRLYEVTTFRRDVDTDGRHAVVSFSDTIEEDLSRRDFTINAIAWHPLRDEWVDPFHGTHDLEDRVLRTVGTAEDRFREDRLRVLRGLRFAGRLGLQIEPATWAAMCGSATFLDALSAERVREELMKVLAGSRPSVALALYRKVGAMDGLYPELTVDAGVTDESFVGALRVVDGVRRTQPVSRLAALLRPVVRAADGETAAVAGLLQRLRCSNVEQKSVVAWITALGSGPPAPDPVARRKWLCTAGRENLPGIARIWAGEARAGRDRDSRDEVASRIREFRNLSRSGEPLTVAELAIGGDDLRAAGLSPGPIFARILRELLDHVLVDPGLNTPEGLLGLVATLVGDEEGIPGE
jgi:tRNA nucleotidyltransferase (CCA-adding enzyme)